MIATFLSAFASTVKQVEDRNARKAEIAAQKVQHAAELRLEMAEVQRMRYQEKQAMAQQHMRAQKDVIEPRCGYSSASLHTQGGKRGPLGHT